VSKSKSQRRREKRNARQVRLTQKAIALSNIAARKIEEAAQTPESATAQTVAAEAAQAAEATATAAIAAASGKASQVATSGPVQAQAGGTGESEPAVGSGLKPRTELALERQAIRNQWDQLGGLKRASVVATAKVLKDAGMPREEGKGPDYRAINGAVKNVIAMNAQEMEQVKRDDPPDAKNGVNVNVNVNTKTYVAIDVDRV
jgi:hypothetical protein